MKTYCLLFLSLLSFAMGAYGSPYCKNLEKNLLPILHDQFWDLTSSRPYVTYRCETNAYHMAGRVLNPEMRAKAKVIAVWRYKRNPNQNRDMLKKIWVAIDPLKARAEKASWSYHVFVMVDGLIIDPDFETTPSVLPLREYLDQMYPKKGKGKLWIASWPVGTYNKSQHVGRYGPVNPEDSLFTVKQFLALEAKSSLCTKEI